MYCEENQWDWYDVEKYTTFIRYLRSHGVKMQKFPLCIKESGGMYERGKDKSKFLEQLSHYNSDESAAHTIKLSAEIISKIRSFKNTQI